MHEAMRPSFRASLSAWGQALNLMTSETRSARVMDGIWLPFSGSLGQNCTELMRPALHTFVTT